MQRNRTPALDLVPVMGLASLLIPLLLLGQVIPMSVIDVNLPAMCDCHGGPEKEALTPQLVLTYEGMLVQVGSEPSVELRADELERLTEVLGQVRDAHTTDGSLVLVPEGDVPYERLIEAMDAARPHFPEVTVAGGVS